MEELIETIGMSLRLARIKQGLSCYEVYRETRIPVSILEALEVDDYSHFSSSSYAKSYLSQYAHFLNVDASDWLRAIGDCHYTHDPHDMAATDWSIVSLNIQEKQRERKSLKLLPSLLVTCISAGLIYGAYQISLIYDQNNSQVSSKNESPARNNATNSPEIAVNQAIPPREATLSTPSQPAESDSPPRALVVEE
jgi:cytoskeletal protein RodZ